MTLGSLFDGIGTWQLAAVRNGIIPLWSSEIDEFCTEITAKHFPQTLQLGDINRIENPPYVDIITAGSPCQDLSVAGKRGGIHAEKSRLFFKAIELVRRIRPKYFIWENVCGAFSSNGGMDFRTILEEISQESIPLPEGWTDAGLVEGRCCQIAWRVLNAEFFGVPQRRKRIFVVADFGTRRAAEILFEPKSVHEDTKSSGESKNRFVGEVALGIGRDAFNQGRNAKYKPAIYSDISPTLRAKGANGVCTNVVRKLTPLECERLQGLEEGWTQGGSDTQRYKALGNGMALPCAEWILKRIGGDNHDQRTN